VLFCCLFGRRPDVSSLYTQGLPSIVYTALCGLTEEVLFEGGPRGLNL